MYDYKVKMMKRAPHFYVSSIYLFIYYLSIYFCSCSSSNSSSSSSSSGGGDGGDVLPKDKQYQHEKWEMLIIRKRLFARSALGG